MQPGTACGIIRLERVEKFVHQCGKIRFGLQVHHQYISQSLVRRVSAPCKNNRPSSYIHPRPPGCRCCRGFFAVSAVQQLAGAEGAGLYCVVCGKAGQHLPCQRAPLGSFCFVHILCRFQQAAGHDGRRGGIPGFAAFRGKEHIPAGDHILRQTGKVERQCFAEHLEELFIVGIGVADGAAVHAPRLSPCPEAVVLVA